MSCCGSTLRRGGAARRAQPRPGSRNARAAAVPNASSPAVLCADAATWRTPVGGRHALTAIAGDPCTPDATTGLSCASDAHRGRSELACIAAGSRGGPESSEGLGRCAAPATPPARRHGGLAAVAGRPVPCMSAASMAKSTSVRTATSRPMSGGATFAGGTDRATARERRSAATPAGPAIERCAPTVAATALSKPPTQLAPCAEPVTSAAAGTLCRAGRAGPRASWAAVRRTGLISAALAPVWIPSTSHVAVAVIPATSTPTRVAAGVLPATVSPSSSPDPPMRSPSSCSLWSKPSATRRIPGRSSPGSEVEAGACWPSSPHRDARSPTTLSMRFPPAEPSTASAPSSSPPAHFPGGTRIWPAWNCGSPALPANWTPTMPR